MPLSLWETGLTSWCSDRYYTRSLCAKVSFHIAGLLLSNWFSDLFGFPAKVHKLSKVKPSNGLAMGERPKLIHQIYKQKETGAEVENPSQLPKSYVALHITFEDALERKGLDQFILLSKFVLILQQLAERARISRCMWAKEDPQESQFL